MTQISITDGDVPLASEPRTAERGPALAQMAWHAGIAFALFVGLLTFYGSIYSVHQDLAGGALSGKLAVTLGNAFANYAVYFPPVERWWFSFAVRLSDAVGIRLDLAVVAMTAAAVLFAAEFAYWIRRTTVGASPLFLVVSVAVLVIVPIVFKNVFGLREHMVALGLWPYVVLRVSDPAGTIVGRAPRALLGLWMGATLLFKYLYCVVVFLVELADAVIQRSARPLFRIENVAAGAVVTLYLFAWLVIDPAQRTAISAMSSAIEANLVDPFANWLHVGDKLYFSLFFLLAYRILKLDGRLTVLGLALVIGAIAAAFAQKRWYSHHLFPVTMAYIAWWWMMGRRFTWWAHVAVPLYLAVPTTKQYLKTAQYQKGVEELESALSDPRLSVAGKRVGILTMHPSPYNQYLASHGAIRWNSMMNNAYVSAELKPLDKRANRGIAPPPVTLTDPGRRMLHDEMLRLWEDQPPEVLILDHSHRWPLRHLDVEWTHVFSKDARFNAILKHYRPVLDYRGEGLIFKYYVRAD